MITAALAVRAEVGRAGVHAQALRLDASAAAVAELPVAAVHRQPAGHLGGDASGVVEVGAELAGRLRRQGDAVTVVELVDRGERAQPQANSTSDL